MDGFSMPIDVAGFTVQVEKPAIGETVALRAGKRALVFIADTGPLASLTIILPPDPIDGQQVVMSFASAITILTLTGGTVRGALTAGLLNGFARYVFSTALNSWIRTG